MSPGSNPNLVKRDDPIPKKYQSIKHFKLKFIISSLHVLWKKKLTHPHTHVQKRTAINLICIYRPTWKRKTLSFNQHWFWWLKKTPTFSLFIWKSFIKFHFKSEVYEIMFVMFIFQTTYAKKGGELDCLPWLVRILWLCKYACRMLNDSVHITAW